MTFMQQATWSKNESSLMFVAIVQSAYLLVCRGPNRSETVCPQTTLATRQAHAHILCHYAGLKSVKLSCHRRSIGPLTPGVLPLGSALLSFCCDSYIPHASLKYCPCCEFRNPLCAGNFLFLFGFLKQAELWPSVSSCHGAFAGETSSNLASVGIQLQTSCCID